MKRNLLLALACSLLFSACSSNNITRDIIQRHPALDRFAEVTVIPLEEKAPPSAITIGTLYIKDSGAKKDCSWDNIIAILKRESRKMGGNTLKIMAHTPPGTAGSKCHAVTAQILKTETPVLPREASPVPQREATLTADDYTLPADSVEKNYPTLRLAASGGYTYRTASLPSGITGVLKNYLEGLSSGFQFSAGGTYFVDKEFGGGIIISHSLYSNSITNITASNSNGQTVTGDIRDDIGILFIGPSFTGRRVSDNGRNTFFATASLGYLGYTCNSVFLDQQVDVTGETLGSGLDIGYDFGVTDELSIGLQLSYITGLVNTLYLDYGTRKETMNFKEGSGESLNRLDFSVGVRFNK